MVEKRRVRSVRCSESGGGGGDFWRERRIIRDISFRVLTGFYTSKFQHFYTSSGFLSCHLLL